MTTIDTVVRLGEHMPLSTRRVVGWLGKTTHADTPIGMVDGLADGVVMVRIKGGPEFELSLDEATDIERALLHARLGVAEWQKRARGYHKITATIGPEGQVFVTWHERTRPMRASELRATRRQPRGRKCGHCHTERMVLYVAADDLREGGIRVKHVEVCPGCVQRLANAPEGLAEVVSIADRGEPK